MAIEQELVRQLHVMGEELDRRTARHLKVLPYSRRIEGHLPIPHAVVQARLTNVYSSLMSMSGMPWGKLIINSKLDRLEPNGIDTGDAAVDRSVWNDVWQLNAMDLEAKLGERAALRDGRAHAIVWPGADGLPEITLEDVTQVVIAYRSGSRRHRVAGLRRWLDDDDLEQATLYRPDGVYKFRQRRSGEPRMVHNTDWIRREVEGETWPLRNPWRTVTAVELAVNRELEPGGFTYARGEYEDELGLMERIDLLTFLGLVVALWMGFPLRGVIGEKILWRNMLTDDGQPIIDPATNTPKQVAEPPFDAHADSFFQLENPDAKLVDYKAADRGNLSIFDELAQLSAATSTPRHYFPMPGGIANVNAATIQAFEGPLHAAVNGSHKPSLGEGFEEIIRLGARMLPRAIEVPPQASLNWADHESRSLGERADAYLKLSQGDGGLPWQIAAELALNLGQEKIHQIEAGQAGSALAQLFAAARSSDVAEDDAASDTSLT